MQSNNKPLLCTPATKTRQMMMVPILQPLKMTKKMSGSQRWLDVVGEDNACGCCG
jgi:hypothetical protein